jgi:two-component system alkaline phosphatase synthesis response regulator PhoP
MSKILVIEDDTFLQTLEVGKLKKNNHEILSATSGEDAMKKILEPGIELVLLDLVLPNFDGFEILKKIRETDSIKKVPVIVFSNLSEEADVNKAKELGANDFMVKSNFTLDELMDRIKLVLKK